MSISLEARLVNYDIVSTPHSVVGVWQVAAGILPRKNNIKGLNIEL